ncbi:ABC transporter permease [Edaphobacter sp. HDX4]|uniref:ABC transporter permease n=1 Tax=Edaphobacter sp. HDX4 TaxID=2794064 RepID=UPI002FE5B9AF
MFPSESLRRLRMLFRGSRFQEELNEEMRLHRELREQELLDLGQSPESARREANLRFGNVTSLGETSYQSWGWSWLESLFQDLRYGTRSMLRSPALTIVALLSLALGIGANTAIFSFIDTLMLRSLPVKDPSQLMFFGKEGEAGVTDRIGSTTLYSYPFFREMQKRNGVFSDVAAIFSELNTVHGTIQGQDSMQPMRVQLVSGSYFPTLGVQAVQGRVLSEADDTIEGAHPILVVSYAWWKRALASDPAALNRKITLGKTTFDIVGIAPPEFFGTSVGEAPDMWVPMSEMGFVPPAYDARKDNFWEGMHLIGRLKPGVSQEQATSNVNVLYQQIIRSFPDADLDARNAGYLNHAHVILTPMAKGLSSLRHRFSEPLKILMGITTLVLLIACANIANLLLARSTARARELAVRQALGAGRLRIVRQLLTESLVLALTGGLLGIGLSRIADRLLLRMISGGSDLVPLEVSINTNLLLFTFAVTVATAILFGIIPAFRSTRLELTDALKDGRGSSSKASSRSPLGKILIVSQIALSLVLMVGAILFIRSLVNLNNVDTGFNREGVLRLDIDSDVIGLKSEDPRMIAMFQEIEQRVSALPGVKAASFASFLFSQGSWNTGIRVVGQNLDDRVNIKHNVVGNEYFAAMQIPLLAGRTFGPQDTTTSHKVAVISERMAKDLFPSGVNPIGHHYYAGFDPKPDTEVEVIGIAKDVKFGDLQESPQYIDYIPNPQHPWGYGTLAVRYNGDFDATSRAVQQTIHSVNPRLPISHVGTLDEQVSSTLTNQRVVAQLSAFFGLLAVFLSCIGIYGLMSYTVGKRTNEIGIRIAIGASRASVRWLVLREIALLTAIGIAVGIPITIAGSRIVGTMLFGLRGADVVSLLTSVVALLAVALLAAYLPARRAASVDPVVALRYE